MRMEKMRKLINNVIENEFNHIQEDKELDEVCADSELNLLRKTLFESIDELSEAVPNQVELIDKLDSEFTNYYTALCRYYFKKGIIASATNLKFLEDVPVIVLI